MNETLQLICQRRSVRDFQNKPVSRKLLEQVLQAGQLAPFAQCENRHFAAVEDKQLLADIRSTCKQAVAAMGIPGLAEMANDPGFDPLYGARTLVVISGEENTASPAIDCAAAAQNILIAAESLGLHTCWMYYPLFLFHGAHADEMLQRLCIPQGYHPYAAVAIGYGKGAYPDMPQRDAGYIDYL